MESLSETPWDVVIEGTGLQQSLLALALSHSNKKILHLDKNEYYGGTEAAFSLQEVEEWVNQVNTGTSTSIFRKASTWKAEQDENDEAFRKLSFSRAYTLALSPQIIYSRSKLLSQLVSSKVYRQLEFQAVGSWWLYESIGPTSTLQRLPNGREDVFSDRSIDLRAKRNLTKFLKFVVNYEDQPDLWRPHAEDPLPEFLSAHFQLPTGLQTMITALTLSLDVPSETIVAYALPRISRHLTSIGVFGPGFGAVIPKWGGMSEIAQVACRAGAVGGGVYILGTGIKELADESPSSLTVTLSNEEKLASTIVVRSQQDPLDSTGLPARSVSKVIAVVSSDLSSLFQSTVEGAPTPAVSVVNFPSNSLQVAGQPDPHPPVYIMVHSADSGECPSGQCVLYGTTLTSDNAKSRLECALSKLLEAVAPVSSESAGKPPRVLYTVHYEQCQRCPSTTSKKFEGVYELSPFPVDLAFEDEVLDNVRDAWSDIIKHLIVDDDEAQQSQFMVFADRAGMEAEHDEDDSS